MQLCLLTPCHTPNRQAPQPLLESAADLALPAELPGVDCYHDQLHMPVRHSCQCNDVDGEDGAHSKQLDVQWHNWSYMLISNVQYAAACAVAIQWG